MSVVRKILLYYNTVKYLKIKQICYRLWYFVRNKGRKFTGFQYPGEKEAGLVQSIFITEPIPVKKTKTPGENHFTFLNREHRFAGPLDWTFAEFGLLWQFHLQYMEYILQPEITVAETLRILESPPPFSPYPVSLRLVNLIKWTALRQSEIPEEALQKIRRSVRAQADYLAAHPEFHLMGNHLLENAIALLAASLCLNDPLCISKYKKMLVDELNEQILPDGAHFELSPMYHHILLGRLLDLYNLLINNYKQEIEFSESLRRKAATMLSWAEWMGIADDRLPHFNDTTQGEAPPFSELKAYAERLGIRPLPGVPMKESGYRAFRANRHSLIADFGPVGPDYIPGHAHCDALSFEWFVDRNPVLVNTGISTYEKNARRHYERGTAAHNTVVVEGEEQSEIWGGFRVARRAKVSMTTDGPDRWSGRVRGFKSRNVYHTRHFYNFENSIEIKDVIEDQKARISFKASRAFFHFYPEIIVELFDDKLKGDRFQILFEGAEKIELETYDYCVGFNRRRNALRAVVSFTGTLTTNIQLAYPLPYR